MLNQRIQAKQLCSDSGSAEDSDDGNISRIKSEEIKVQVKTEDQDVVMKSLGSIENNPAASRIECAIDQDDSDPPTESETEITKEEELEEDELLKSLREEEERLAKQTEIRERKLRREQEAALIMANRVCSANSFISTTR